MKLLLNYPDTLIIVFLHKYTLLEEWKKVNITAITERRCENVWVQGHLGDLCLQVPVFCFQAAFLSQSCRQRRILGV